MLFVLFIIFYGVAVNVLAYHAFARDKYFAISKQQRTPERRLLLWASLGGWAGAKYAQQTLRHKSYKQPFGRHLNEIGMIQAMVLGLLALTFGVLMLVSVSEGFSPSRPTAGSTLQPAPEPPAISLRPPAARPARW